MASEQKYVVLHDQLGSFAKAKFRGDVVSVDDLHGQAEVDRHLGNRAIRKATAEESALKHIDLPMDDRSIKSAEEQHARYTTEILSLRAENARLQRDLQNARMAATPAASPVPQGEQPWQKVVAEKDEAIRQLQQRLAEKEKQSASGKK